MNHVCNENIKNIFITNNQLFLAPHFDDCGRLDRVKTLLPEIQEMYRKHAETNRYPGYAYGLVLDGKLIYADSGGYMDLEKKIHATPRSMFRIASMTKCFTAMAILKLRDEGKLRLDDLVKQYIPELQSVCLTIDAIAITIRDLLIHNAGFPTDNYWGDRQLETTEEQFRRFLDETVSFSTPPGSGFEYSNLGYTLLGYIINKITGVPYQKYIDVAICQPLGMTIYWEYADVPSSELVHGYRYDGDLPEKEPMLHDGIYGAMGGIITSIESYARFVALHQEAWPSRDEIESGPMRRSSLREMHKAWNFIRLETDFKYSQEKEQALVSAYGYGLKWIRDSSGRIFLGHRGGLPGFGSNWFFLPEYGLGIVSFANLLYADTSRIDLDILNKLLIEAKLTKRPLPLSNVLREKKEQLMRILPNWENIPEGVFADNFFLDRPLKHLIQESKNLFLKAGNIISIDQIIPDNQLSGSIVLRGEKSDLQINIALSPENPPLIQEYGIKLIERT